MCQLCSKPGHLASCCYQCFNIEFSGVGATNLDHLIANIATTDTIINSSWYPESRATSQCTADESNFTHKEPYFSNEHIYMGDGACLPINSVGKKVFYTQFTLKSLTLNHILHVLQITKD
uniref:Retrovirus-related Pol polyprotein from transposon TNT 1-94-like beta-barrel domain-containing protein n=1 Tax=Cannabis sativa TaxID=3483 RepID=A0A803QY99_CANSA